MERSRGPKSTPTIYAGTKFRSRLEARWAVFFDCLGIRWCYELEGYQLKSGWYLPDFWLPELCVPMFVEVKPKEPTHREVALACDLCLATEQRVLILFQGLFPPSFESAPGNPNIVFDFCPKYVGIDDGPEPLSDDNEQWWCECPKCHKIGIAYQGRGERVCGDKCCPDGHRDFTYETDRMVNAYSAARSHRFTEVALRG